MTDLILKSLEVNNFRSIRGRIHVPLDANVVLVHGENGAGKTSLLSAIELALTGNVQSLQRADPNYQKQLVHRLAMEGSVNVTTLLGTVEQDFTSALSPIGARSVHALDQQHAAFFRERAFLPQSLLGQLLQIYQDAGNDAASPLAQFVAKLLGLDQLDALEAGLKPLADVRNVRKSVDGWLLAENEKLRFDRLLSDQRKTRNELNVEIQSELNEISAHCTSLGLPIEVREELLDELGATLSGDDDANASARLMDQQRALASVGREIDSAQKAVPDAITFSQVVTNEARQEFGLWEVQHGARVIALRSRIEAILPDVSLPSDPEKLSEVALTRLRIEQKQLADSILQSRADIARLAVAKDERDVVARKVKIIDQEVSRLPLIPGSLGSVLAELSAFIRDETCPACDRDFRELGAVTLSEHIHKKVRVLSASADRLLTLGRARSESQTTIERLEKEIEAIVARKVEDKILADLDRVLSTFSALVSELESITEVLREGGRLRAADVAARRTVNQAQARHVSLATARATLTDFALSIEGTALDEGESFEAAVVRLNGLLSAQRERIEQRLSTRRRIAERIGTIRSAVIRRKELDERIAADSLTWKRADRSLEDAQELRQQGNTIRTIVDQVRSGIIRREFNDRLNRVWRDLFVRLAPGEPFVPAFKIPESSTQNLQPKLITEHRDGGDAGGTPGAMLSAGNLNTAALTLFIALHLSVPRELPWLILDDPVQSMDDVHIAQFAALLKTLSKEHGRQVVIAVHDRQLFEYLKLELSPAYPEDSLLTLELSRGPRRDTICIPQRFSFRQEPTFFFAA